MWLEPFGGSCWSLLTHSRRTENSAEMSNSKLSFLARSLSTNQPTQSPSNSSVSSRLHSSFPSSSPSPSHMGPQQRSDVTLDDYWNDGWEVARSRQSRPPPSLFSENKAQSAPPLPAWPTPAEAATVLSKGRRQRLTYLRKGLVAQARARQAGKLASAQALPSEVNLDQKRESERQLAQSSLSSGHFNHHGLRPAATPSSDWSGVAPWAQYGHQYSLLQPFWIGLLRHFPIISDNFRYFR